MVLFDKLVSKAMEGYEGLAPIQPVVEKELLHHDILREMSEAGLLSKLTFIGGTCLRACYGSSRLSEDLDFTGGGDFSRESMTSLKGVLIKRLYEKYGLPIDVSEPVREGGNVDTWKLRITTRPGSNYLPAQRIHIDICAIPSYDSRPMMLRNHYGVDMGTSGLILRAESREEIFADKMIALSLRPNRIKNRDLWDIAWLHQQGVILPVDLVQFKIDDHHSTKDVFAGQLKDRVKQIRENAEVRDGFIYEMRRFLPQDIVRGTVERNDFWSYLVDVVDNQSKAVLNAIDGKRSAQKFRM